ncbi:2-dehydro-3-deoxy-D-arabinonate dehydratase [Filimonas lacunae]|uniref:2-dehydro-3-deoxy-D-arabinonate dehydratase n=1 Tax=Filimonas lacunae TaxID=477680 RepID=A0A173MGR5_9BACT|nr:fumarylacetoacetate hydrolase family protein [Filimonas lacunae]BAV06785.1 fumarylacetoacetate hydrolase family protein [Filimonas lacunae]SIT34363.1 2-dehydro-3-deoxy-D-arabinonate dehydratase [Filimonas lacunae]
MKVYKTQSGALLEAEGNTYTLPVTDWEAFINNDDLYNTLTSLLASGKATATPHPSASETLPPIGPRQELWACGVTYWRSKVGRQEESKASGGGDFYEKVYHAERPEVFFKSTPSRVVGPGQPVRIRKDSTWDVPEPELTLVVTSSGKIIGYTIGNDMSSRSIEGENPLYLPQAKTYDGCAALGPCIYVTNQPLPAQALIRLTISRNGEQAFTGDVELSQMKRTPEELVSFVYRESSFPHGCLIMTGTGIVPGHDFTLQSGDEISIGIDGIGTLTNTVA